MSIILKENCIDALGEQQKMIRALILAGYRQIEEGKYKDFNSVCDRLEEKYSKCSSIK